MYNERLFVKLVSLEWVKFFGLRLSSMRRKWLIFALIVRLRLVGGVIFKRKLTGGVGVAIVLS